MATFICDRCGKCCRSFGAFITPERQLGERDYYCRYGITGEIFLVNVQPEYAGEIADAFDELTGAGQDASGRACIFLRENRKGRGYSCAVYPSRPSVCRDFLCYRMLIYLDASGELRGKVIGANDLRTKDAVLKEIWDEEISKLPRSDDSAWSGSVLKILASHGYRGEPVEG
ncbi:MAG: Flagellin N-methylase [Methanoregula sp. PtaU1.Bin051]|nr:MAG: Flagellin N-methylase [Methanoregula sp. PtaU1.Bin051]